MMPRLKVRIYEEPASIRSVFASDISFMFINKQNWLLDTEPRTGPAVTGNINICFLNKHVNELNSND
jgi:hypothetical protein